MIQLELVGDKEILARLDRGKLQAAFKDGLVRGALAVLRVAKQKLSDDVLHVRSGRLRARTTMVQSGTDDRPVCIVGSATPYAGVHEFGFDGAVNVKSFLRKGHPVKAFSRNMHMPERSFLRSALNECQPEIAEEIKAAVAEVLR